LVIYHLYISQIARGRRKNSKPVTETSKAITAKYTLQQMKIESNALNKEQRRAKKKKSYITQHNTDAE
jgi:hypothetical protein